MAAAAGIHGGDKLETRGKGDMRIGARDDGLAGFERLAQTVQHLTRKLRQFIQKQNAAMGERDLARLHAQAAADKGGHGGRMMRRAVGTAAADTGLPGARCGERGDHRGFEHLARGKRRQDAGEAGGEHGLAGARRADHQHVVALPRRDFQRALRRFLALDVAQVRHRPRLRRLHRRGLGEDLGAPEMVDQRDDGPRRKNAAGIVRAHARPGGLRPAFMRADEALAARIGGDGGGQRARDRVDRAVEREFADDDEALDLLRRQDAHGNEQAERDGQVVMAALLGEIGGGEIDGDALGGQAEAYCLKRRADPLAAFGDRLVAETHHGETDNAAAAICTCTSTGRASTP